VGRAEDRGSLSTNERGEFKRSVYLLRQIEKGWRPREVTKEGGEQKSFGRSSSSFVEEGWDFTTRETGKGIQIWSAPKAKAKKEDRISQLDKEDCSPS